MTKAPITTRPEGGKNPDTTGAGGPAMDPKSGISPPQAIPEDQGTYQDQNDQYSEEEVAQQAANLTGNKVEGKEPENKLGGENDPAPEDSPELPSDTPSEPAPDDFSDLDNPA